MNKCSVFGTSVRCSSHDTEFPLSTFNRRVFSLSPYPSGVFFCLVTVFPFVMIPSDFYPRTPARVLFRVRPSRLLSPEDRERRLFGLRRRTIKRRVRTGSKLRPPYTLLDAVMEVIEGVASTKKHVDAVNKPRSQGSFRVRSDGTYIEVIRSVMLVWNARNCFPLRL